jgi:hypothetical protein
MGRKRSKYVGLYGNVAIQKGECPECLTTAFILEGRYACCGRRYGGDTPDRYKREVSAWDRRKKPKKEDQDKVLSIQDNRCIYCGVEFGKHVIRNGRAICLKINWDHFVPYSYSQNNYSHNFVAACHICNSLKSNLCFKTLDEAQIYIQDKRTQKGII